MTCSQIFTRCIVLYTMCFMAGATDAKDADLQKQFLLNNAKSVCHDRMDISLLDTSLDGLFSINYNKITSDKNKKFFISSDLKPRSRRDISRFLLITFRSACQGRVYSDKLYKHVNSYLNKYVN